MPARSSRSSRSASERGRFAGFDPDLTRLTVDADLGRAAALQSDLHGEADGELLPRDAPVRLQGPEVVELGACRCVELGVLFPRRAGLALQLGRLPRVLAGRVERRGGCPCRAQHPEVAGALALHLEYTDLVAVPAGSGHRIAQEALSLLERRLPLGDVGRERRDLLFPLSQRLRAGDLPFVFLPAALEFQAAVLRLLLAQPPLLLAGGWTPPACNACARRWSGRKRAACSRTTSSRSSTRPSGGWAVRRGNARRAATRCRTCRRWSGAATG